MATVILEQPETSMVTEPPVRPAQARSAWDDLAVDEPATTAQRAALYRLNVIRKEVVKTMTKEQASEAIQFSIRMRQYNSITISNTQPYGQP